MRRALAVVLCACLLAGAPGPAAYAAVERGIETPVEPLAAPMPLVSSSIFPENPVLQISPAAISAVGAAAALAPAEVEAAAQAQAAAGAQTPLSAASAMAQAEAALAAPQAAERDAPTSLETAEAAGRETFDDAPRAQVSAIDDVPAAGLASQTEPLERAAKLSPPPSRAQVVSRLVYKQAAAVTRWASQPRVALSLAAFTVMAFAAPHLSFVPLIAATCNSMRERQIKDATILPEQNTQREIATKELDRILVNFGKRLKAEAEKDARVKSKVTAHNAEHAMENPILELLPAWKERYGRAQGPEKQAALAELRAEVLARLAQTTLKNESPEVIEELLNKTGSWDEFVAWEGQHQVFDALKKAAEKEAAVKHDGVTKEKERGDSSGMSGTGGAVLGLLLFIGAGLALHAIGVGGGLAGVALIAAVVMPRGDAPPQPAVPLEKYLADLGLSKEEADFLKSFTTDVGARDLAPVVGRSKELRRVITILSKPPGTQNNPMILGDKGVGKTAIVEAIAKYLYYDKLPSLKGKRILELDTGKLAAGTGKVGEMEERLTNLRAILAKTNNKVILFVDEIHSILKNNTTSNAVPDLLKSPLRNGEITVIGATTVGEYRKYVETDPAFADRFDPVQVDEPTQDEAIEMLEGDLEYLERKFGVEIDPEAAKAAVKLSARYIPEKFLPRKARVLLESSIAEAKPEAARDGVQVQIDQYTDRLRLFVKRYAVLKAVNDPAKKAEEIQTYNKIVALYTSILALDEKSRSFVQEKIGKEHVMRTLAKETGIELGDLGEDEYKRLLKMEPWFKERIVGQDEAIKALADTVRTNKSGLSDPNRPQGVFLFAGKTGTGKTALARTLAEFLFSNPDAVVRLDMSEYMEKFAVQRLFGAPPGYVGYDSGGELTEKVRRQPYSVILLDEIEKAHPDVLNALLQVFDAGRMTDGRQNTVNFKNTIIIMTSNIGSGSDAEGEEFKSDVVEAIKARLRPEFVNRVDKIVVFNPLVLEQAKSILEIMLKDVQKRLREQDLELRVSPEAKDFLARKGFDPAYGARPMKRVVESDVTNAISGYLLAQKAEGNLVNGGIIDVGVKDGALAFDLKPNPPPVLEPSPLPDGPLGAKLRRILDEAVRGPEATKDSQTFESLLFPDRKAVVLNDALGAFKPNAQPDRSKDLNGESFVRGLGAGAPGLKDEKLEALKGEIFGKLEGRLPEGTAREAATAWLDAFAKLSKGISKESVSLQYRVPAADRAEDAELMLLARGDTGFAAQQKLARLFRDHFSTPLPDEDAARARAAQMKDEGLAPDRELLDLKRLVESVPGATFGYVADEALGGTWRFWLRLPAKGAQTESAQPAEEKQPDAKSEAAPDAALNLDAPVTALDARLSPAKMFLFLTQRAPDALRQRRALTAELLDSKSTQARLIGLHMAASLLEPSALREVASASRMLRLSDVKDYALFSALAARVPGLPMTAQRQALTEAVKLRLASFRNTALTSSYSSAGDGAESRFYGELAAPLLTEPSPAEAAKNFAQLESIRLRFTRIVKRFVGWGSLGVALAETGLHFLKAPHFLMFALPIVVGLILWWIVGANFYDVRDRGRTDSTTYESLVMPRLSPALRLALARRRLEAASRGAGWALDLESQTELAIPALAAMKDDEKIALFRRWARTIDKGLARQQAKGQADAPAFGTLGLLARLARYAPDAERAKISKLLLEPLRRRWLPSGSNEYLAGLGAWAQDSKFSPAELEDFIGLIVNFPSGQQATTASFLPVYRALARRGDLPPDLKAAFDQFVEGIVAESTASNRVDQIFPSLELARSRAELGYARKAWAGARETLAWMSERPDNWGGEPSFRALDSLVKEAPPTPEEREWLMKSLRIAETMPSAELKAQAALPLARLTGDDAERLALLLVGLREVTVETGRRSTAYSALYRDLLDELAKAAAAPLRDPATVELWSTAVRENAARLNAAP